MRILQLWLTATGKKTRWLVAWRLVAVAGLNLLVGAGSADAQNVCVNPAFKGEFTVNKARVCVGELVDISSPPNIVNVGYNPQYDGKGIPASITRSTSFTYAQPGSYTIIQVGSGGGSGTGTIACQEVTVVAREPVAFTPIICSGRKVALDIKVDGATAPYDQYIIRWGDGTTDVKTRAEISAQKPIYTYRTNGTNNPTIAVYGIYGTPSAVSCEGPVSISRVALSGVSNAPSITRLTTTGDNSITIQYQANTGVGMELFQKDANGLYAPTGQKGTSAGTFTVQTNAKQVQCFQVVAQDGCTAAGQRSDEICSLVLTASAINKINDLSWNPYAGTISAATQFRRYQINRNGSSLITYFDRNVGDHRDVSKIECNTQYCYTLEAILSGAVETVVTSAPVCVTGINGDLPDGFRSVLVSVENNHPRLVAALPITGTSSSYTLAVSRADGPSGTFQPVGAVANKNTFIDETANPSVGPYCYQLTYLTKCGLASPPSQPVCTVFLGSQSRASIDWTAASPFTPGLVADYTVEVTDSVSGTNREIQVGGNLRYEPDPNDPTLQSQKYRIIVASNTGQRSYSNYFTLRRESIILVPDAFTPNGDGVNDEFVAKGIYVDRFSMTIYNRWGQVIYATSDRTKGWDGTANGQSLAAGQYMYRIDAQDLTNLKTVRTGTVLLIR